jgi:hypothetical protein
VLLKNAVLGRRRLRIRLIDFFGRCTRVFIRESVKETNVRLLFIIVAGDTESSCYEQSDTEQTSRQRSTIKHLVTDGCVHTEGGEPLSTALVERPY